VIARPPRGALLLITDIASLWWPHVTAAPVDTAAARPGVSFRRWLCLGGAALISAVSPVIESISACSSCVDRSARAVRDIHDRRRRIFVIDTPRDSGIVTLRSQRIRNSQLNFR
jgi:hypothetical protein